MLLFHLGAFSQSLYLGLWVRCVAPGFVWLFVVRQLLWRRYRGLGLSATVWVPGRSFISLLFKNLQSTFDSFKQCLYCGCLFMVNDSLRLFMTTHLKLWVVKGFFEHRLTILIWTKIPTKSYKPKVCVLWASSKLVPIAKPSILFNSFKNYLQTSYKKSCLQILIMFVQNKLQNKTLYTGLAFKYRTCESKLSSISSEGYF